MSIQIDWRAITELIKYEPAKHYSENGRGVRKLREEVFHFWMEFFSGSQIPNWKNAVRMAQYWHTCPTFLIRGLERKYGGRPLDPSIDLLSMSFRGSVIRKNYGSAKETFYEIIHLADESNRTTRPD